MFWFLDILDFDGFDWFVIWSLSNTSGKIQGSLRSAATSGKILCKVLDFVMKFSVRFAGKGEFAFERDQFFRENELLREN